MNSIAENIISNKPKYPYIGRYYKGIKPFYVLFTAPKTGVVINSQLANRPVGHQLNSWAEDDCFAVDNDVIITLSNK